MTTKSSPVRVLQAQAKKIAAMLKAAERGEKVDVLFSERIEAARQHSGVKFGIVMDDKIITIETPWSIIRETTEAGLSSYILDQMRETRHAVN